MAIPLRRDVIAAVLRRIARRSGRSTGSAPVPRTSVMRLPAKAPELNPVETVWQFLRRNWLSNRVFPSYDDILDHCRAAWSELTDQL